MVGKFFVLQALVVCAMAVSSADAAEKKTGLKLFGDVCTREAEPIDGAPRQASLSPTRKLKNTYSGPSVFCKANGNLQPTTQFTVLGITKNRLGGSWYLIQHTDSNTNRWVSVGDIVLGDSVPIEQTVQVKEARVVTPTQIQASLIPSTILSSPIDLSVRMCPQTQCDRVGTVSKNKHYQSDRQAANGWYRVELEGSVKGWASNKYLTPIKDSSDNETQLASTLPAEEVSLKPEAKAPPFDPCRVTPKVTYYKVRKMWLLKAPITIAKSPHEQCGKRHSLEVGKALVPIAETEDYYLIAWASGTETVAGYLQKTKFQDQYIPMFELDRNFDVYSSRGRAYLDDHEAYWASYRYKVDQFWKDFKQWIDDYTAQALCVFALILGLLCLLTKITRRLLLAGDQMLIRSGYFMLRSRYFWRMMRRLGFLILLSIASLFIINLYAAWMIEVANTRQQIMGAVSLTFILMSLGSFAIRIFFFILGITLLFLSGVEFILFGCFLLLIFLLPSLLLLAGLYLRYRGQENNSEEELSGVFDRAEVERLQDKLFRLRNLYPETIVTMFREGNFNQYWEEFKNALYAQSQRFNAFFASVNGSESKPA
ncbi:MAG: SH3 domain-containing protein [Gammaproteobacteria bacterium]|nr:SH3 domain-containing protein [Gammaproteobacteria bacterium]